MSLRRIVLISRPLMWPWTVLIYLVGVGNFSNFSALAAVELLFFTFPLNFYLYGLNDIYDSRSDRLNDRKNGAQGIAPNDQEIALLKKTVWLPAALFLIAALFSFDLTHIILAGAFIALSFTYSHPRIRLKEIPILDCLNSAAIYALPGLIAYSLPAPILALPPAVFWLLLPYMGVHAMTTLVDEEADRRAGMTTIAVVFKKRITTVLVILLFAAGAYGLREYRALLSIFLVTIFLEIVFLVAKGSDEKYFRFAISAVLLALGMVAMLYFILQANFVS